MAENKNKFAYRIITIEKTGRKLDRLMECPSNDDNHTAIDSFIKTLCDDNLTIHFKVDLYVKDKLTGLYVFLKQKDEGLFTHKVWVLNPDTKMNHSLYSIMFK